MSTPGTGANPYAAPSAPLVREGGAPESMQFLPQGRTVSAGRGWSWIVEAWNFFSAAPGTWVGITVVFFLLMVVLGVVQGLLALIPVIGSAIAPLPDSLLAPIFITGMVIGCAAIQRDERFEFNHLFAAFKTQPRRIAIVGAITFVATFIVMTIGMLIAGDDLTVVFIDSIANLRLPSTRGQLGILVALGLFIPVAAAAWFAPTLIVFHHLHPIEAMKASFIGTMRNFLPMFVYGLIALVPMILATLPIMLGWLVLWPVFVASIYTSYRDIYLR